MYSPLSLQYHKDSQEAFLLVLNKENMHKRSSIAVMYNPIFLKTLILLAPIILCPPLFYRLKQRFIMGGPVFTAIYYLIYVFMILCSLPASA